MTDWTQLKHAYGTADDIPDLLDRVEPDLMSQTWTDVWSRLCHQGTVYSASFAALPVLAEKARAWSPADRVMPLVLAGAIFASRDQAHGRIDAHRDYAPQIAELIELVDQALQDPNIASTNYLYLLQALMAFEAVAVWDQHLELLVEEEFDVLCPVCEAENAITIREDSTFVARDDDQDGGPIPLLPATPADLEGAAQRLHTQAVTDGRAQVAHQLAHLFGQARCAYCDSIFRLDQAIASQWGG